MYQRMLFIVIGLLVYISATNEVVYAQLDTSRILEDIRSAYERLDFTIAEARINEALEEYEQFSPQELSEIYVIYSLILFAQSDLTAAASQLRLAVQLNPSLVLDPIDTPPRLFQLFEEIKQAQEDQSEQVGNRQEVRYLVIYDPRAGAALRSMVVPGWGQLYKGDKRKGIILTSLWGITASGSIVAHVNRKQAQRHYRASETQDQTQSRFRAYSNWHKVRNNLILAAASIWAYSYIDAVVWGRPAGTDMLNGTPFKFAIIPVNGNTHLSVRWHF